MIRIENGQGDETQMKNKSPVHKKWMLHGFSTILEQLVYIPGFRKNLRLLSLETEEVLGHQNFRCGPYRPGHSDEASSIPRYNNSKELRRKSES